MPFICIFSILFNAIASLSFAVLLQVLILSSVHIGYGSSIRWLLPSRMWYLHIKLIKNEQTCCYGILLLTSDLVLPTVHSETITVDSIN